MKPKIILPAVAAILAVAFVFAGSAFKDVPASTFDYVMTTGDKTNPLHRTNPANYTQQSGTLSCPSGSTAFCKIRATDNGSGKPIISSGTPLYNALNVSGPLPNEADNLVWRRSN